MDTEVPPVKFFQTEITSNRKETKNNMKSISVDSNTANSGVDVSQLKSPEKFKPEISVVHMRRTPTPTEGTRKLHQDDKSTSETSLLKFLTMRKFAKQVRKIQINRQMRLDYTGNETIEHKVKKFKAEEVEPVVFKFLKDNLEGLSYDPEECSELSKELSEELRETVKAMKYPRYKFVAMVTLGEKERQTVTIGSRSLWNKDTDTCACVHYTNGSLFAVAMIFATFFE